MDAGLAYVVLGMGKSGTTALFSAITNALLGPVDQFFEIHDPSAIGRSDPAHSLVAKVLLEKVQTDDLDWLDATFDKRLLLVRDPRDLLVSRLLYKVRDMDLIFDDDKVSTWLDALRAKERDPASIGVVELYRLLESLSGPPSYLDVFARVHRSALAKWRRLEDSFFLVKYEDFIDGETEEASAYVGLDLTSDVDVDERWQRVARSRGYGDWKRWFLESDLEYVQSQVPEFLAAFGYDADWETDPAPVIESETCSRYVERIVTLRRSGRG